MRDIAYGRLHFSHVFIDEAGQALAAESLVPLTLAAPNATVLLAGARLSQQEWSRQARNRREKGKPHAPWCRSGPQCSDTCEDTSLTGRRTPLEPCPPRFCPGDPKQLGPSLHSKSDVMAALSRSLLEECMAVARHEEAR